MGRGNVHVTGSCEGLYYIDNDHFHIYRRDIPDNAEECESKMLGEISDLELNGGGWLIDEEETRDNERDILDGFIESFTNRFPSFHQPDPSKLWLDRDRHVILESSLFHIAVEDNEWSLAVELVQKEGLYGDSLHGLQARHYQNYLEGMKRCLLEYLPSIGIRTGAWTSDIIKREECFV